MDERNERERLRVTVHKKETRRLCQQKRRLKRNESEESSREGRLFGNHGCMGGLSHPTRRFRGKQPEGLGVWSPSEHPLQGKELNRCTSQNDTGSPQGESFLVYFLPSNLARSPCLRHGHYERCARQASTHCAVQAVLRVAARMAAYAMARTDQVQDMLRVGCVGSFGIRRGDSTLGPAKSYMACCTRSKPRDPSLKVAWRLQNISTGNGI